MCIERHNMTGRLSSALEAQLNSEIFLLVSAYGFENTYEVSTLVGMLIKILTDWLRNGMKESIEDMTMITYKIITKFNCIPGL